MIGLNASRLSATGINLSISAVDATANAFRSVSKRLSAFKVDASSVGAFMKGFGLSLLPAAAFAGSVRSFGLAARAMSELSDRAADAMTRASGGEDVV